MDESTNQLQEPAESAPAPVPLPPPVTLRGGDGGAFGPPVEGPAVEGQADEPKPAWGFWATTGWLLVLMAVALSVQVAGGVVIGFAYGFVHGFLEAVRGTAFAGEAGFEALFEDHYGLITSVFGAISMVAAVAFLALPIWLRGWRWSDYLAMGRVSWRQVLVVAAVAMAAVALESSLAHLFQRPIPEDMLHLRRTVGLAPLLWFFVVAVAPVAEELVFRGFVYRGWAASRVGPVGAIVLASLAWTALHVQYEVFELGWVFVLGLVLGAIRWMAGSVMLCIVMHAVVNLVAVVVLELLWGTLS